MSGPAVVTSPALLWGLSLQSDWQDAVQVQGYADIDTLTGSRMSLTGLNCNWGKGHNPDGTLNYRPFPTARLQADRAAGRYSQVTWFGQNLSNPSDQSFNLRSIVLGQHDAYITQWAKAAAAWGHPFFLRFNHEMNGWWFGPCCEQDSSGRAANGNQIGDYVKAWQRAFDIFQSVGATNATWLWCPNIVEPSESAKPTSPSKLAQFFPGRRYVHRVGPDIYNWSRAQNAPWMTFSQRLRGFPSWCGDTFAAITALAPGVPWFIGELGCNEDANGDKGAWIADALATMASNPLFSGWCWFNWSFPPTAWPITSSTGATAGFAAAVAQPGYLGAGGFPFGPDLATVPAYVLASTPDQDASLAQAQAQLAASVSQLQAASADATATHAALDRASASLSTATASLATVTDSLAAATTSLAAEQARSAGLATQLDQYRAAAAHVTGGLDVLRSMSAAG